MEPRSSDPSSTEKPPFLQVAFGILFGLALSALVLILSSPPKMQPIRILPTPTPEDIFVSINGEVALPGLYSLPSGSRVVDLLEAAGGLTPLADSASVNLAVLLVDGQNIRVLSTDSKAVSGTAGTLPEASTNYPININTASAEELQSLPGIGAKKAEDIVRYRETNGFYEVIEDIMNVPGIGLATFEAIKELISAR